MSQETSADVVKEALTTGARGYVVKTDVGRELLTAVGAVLRGEQFVGSRFADHDFTGASDARVSEGDPGNSDFTPLKQKVAIAHCHEVGFYFDDTSLLDGITRFVGASLNGGKSAIGLATETHRYDLLPRLQDYGLDIGVAIEQGRYITLDAAETLSTFMVNGMPDPIRFFNVAGDLLLNATKAAKGETTRVAVCGEG